MTDTRSHPRTYLPALRGHIGDWIYYCTLMTLSEISARVVYARLLHPSTKLSDLIQRTLDEGSRAGDIATYLMTNDDRFFNALVVAVYKGSPDWHQIDRITPTSKAHDVEADIPDLARRSIGFLSLTGNEELFALDGQHRLAGIKKAVAESNALADEEVPIIFVAQKSNSRADIRRTRKLFTTLNKTARPVKKNEIIALDESDVMALTARYLIEGSSIFRKEQIDVSRKQANLPQGDTKYWMTITNLYDALEILLRKGDRTASMTQKLKFQRPADDALEEYFRTSEQVFKLLGKRIKSIGQLLEAKDPSIIIRKHRTAKGGHVLFRPIGVLIFAELVAAQLKVGISLAKAIDAIITLPMELASPPYLGTIWDNGRINTKKRALVRDVLLYRLKKLRGGSKAVDRLKAKYAEALGKAAKNVSLDK